MLISNYSLIEPLQGAMRLLRPEFGCVETFTSLELDGFLETNSAMSENHDLERFQDLKRGELNFRSLLKYKRSSMQIFKIQHVISPKNFYEMQIKT